MEAAAIATDGALNLCASTSAPKDSKCGTVPPWSHEMWGENDMFLYCGKSHTQGVHNRRRVEAKSLGLSEWFYGWGQASSVWERYWKGGKKRKKKNHTHSSIPMWMGEKQRKSLNNVHKIQPENIRKKMHKMVEKEKVSQPGKGAGCTSENG